MKNYKVIALILFLVFVIVIFFLFPIKQAFIFTETRTPSENLFYVPMSESSEFQIRYVHSIHLTDVIESYEVTANQKIRFVSMTYESLGIGLPGYAGEGETFSMTNGMYALTYDDKVLESFTMLIGNVDAALVLHYGRDEIDLKEQLIKGKSYKFSVSKLSCYKMLKGVNLHAERPSAKW